MASMYDGITDKLSRYDGEYLKLSYADINCLIKLLHPKKQLPPHSYINTAWWSNDQNSHTQSKAWLRAGWKTDMAQSNLGEYIVFVKSS